MRVRVCHGGEQRAHRNADEGLLAIPARIEHRNLVGEKLDEQKATPERAGTPGISRTCNAAGMLQITQTSEYRRQRIELRTGACRSPRDASREGNGLNDITILTNVQLVIFGWVRGDSSSGVASES